MNPSKTSLFASESTSQAFGEGTLSVPTFIPSQSESSRMVQVTQTPPLSRRYDGVNGSTNVPWRPVRTVKFDRSRGVTWTHLIEGQWLLVATSDTSVSDLYLWGVSALLAHTDGTGLVPTATAYLSGPVAAGLVDVQNGRIIVALEVQSSPPTVEIVGLATLNNEVVFERLASLPGIARMRALAGDLLGYAVHHEVSIPSLVNWKTKRSTHFSDSPDVQGGCMAMAVRSDIVAVLNPHRLEIYLQVSNAVTDSPSYQLRTLVALECEMRDPSLAFLDESALQDLYFGQRPLCALRLLFTADSGLFVHDISIPLIGTGHQLYETWTYPMDLRFLRHRPSFGRSLNSVVWYDLPVRSPWKPATLSSVTLPPTPSSLVSGHIASSCIRVVDDSDLPGLHIAAVSSYDDVSAIIALGNACGELRLYSFRVDKLQDVDGYLPFISMPCHTSGDILATTPIRSHVAPPYPHSLFGAPKEPPSYTLTETPLRTELLARLTREQDFQEAIPSPWTSNLLSSEYDDDDDGVPWWRFLPTMDCVSIVWAMEHTAHYYGTSSLLLYNEQDRLAIFKMGGLLFLSNGDTGKIVVIRSGVTATQLARASNERRLGGLIAHTVCDGGMQSPELYRFFILCQWEKHILGRNRWAELQARGGEVAPEFLGDELFVPEDHVH